MITCELNGRMGNQMFQIAAVIGTALKYGVPYSIPKRTLNDLFPVYFTDLPDLPITGKIISYHEPKNEYVPIEYSGRTLKLKGYFQSYKYFHDCRKEIIDAFGFYRHIKHYVSIHVRRSDYLELSDFNVLSIYYYYQAINFFKDKGQKDFIVFSDDIAWCKQNINSNLYHDCTFEYREGHTPKQDMELMSWCNYNIIANSSFSWWAAWLNQNPDKIVVAPDTWFKGVNKDMIPKEWIIFKNE